MRYVLILIIGLMAAPLQAQESSPADIITRQFDAFRQGDIGRAFTFASPELQRYFGNARNFGLMVQHGYAMVLNPDRTRMLELREEGGRTIQRVEVIDAKGVLHLLDYDMIETENGWRINGVSFVPAPPMAV